MNKNTKILVAGANGLLGSAIVSVLSTEGYTNILSPNRGELDFKEWQSVKNYFLNTKPDYVFFSAAKVGGVKANQLYPADFIIENLRMETNLFEASHLSGVKKLLFLASSCVYPRNAAQPIREDELFQGSLDQAHSPYATAKIAGLEMCKAYRKQYSRDYVGVIPTNIYGPRDRFGDLENSHVIPALITKFHNAKLKKTPVDVWGNGESRRDLLHSYDVARACIFLAENYSSDIPVNIGSGRDYSIREIVSLLAKITDFNGDVNFDVNQPEGTPRRLLDTSLIRSLGWEAKFTLEEGLSQTYDWFLENVNSSF